MNHCGGGKATDQFDSLAELQSWVEEGKAPQRIVARGAAFPGRTRPLCPYPNVARYTGSEMWKQSPVLSASDELRRRPSTSKFARNLPSLSSCNRFTHRLQGYRSKNLFQLVLGAYMHAARNA